MPGGAVISGKGLGGSEPVNKWIGIFIVYVIWLISILLVVFNFGPLTALLRHLVVFVSDMTPVILLQFRL